MAVATGILVANLYYAQPLLATLAAAFHTGARQAGLVVTLTQLGYAAGLLLIVPLGDLVDRRRLTLLTLGLAVLALLGAARSPSLFLFALASVALGLSSVAAQVLVPFAASLAAPERRGRVVGAVMSGLLLGILLARTVSGLLAAWAGWRSVYLAAAGAVLLLGAVLARFLPADPRPPPAPGERPLNYRELMSSLLQLVREDQGLRRRSALGALGFAAFSLFWTSLAFLLSGPPYRYGEGVIGLFGLAGAAGALAAGFAGRLADRGQVRAATLGFVLLVVLSFPLLGLGARSLTALLLGVVLLDLGVQGLHISNQSVIYSRRPEARSRVTTIYLTSYFMGGALGSLGSALLFAGLGWAGVCWAGAACGVGALGLAWRSDGGRQDG